MPKFMSGERQGTILLVILITIIVTTMTLCKREAIYFSNTDHLPIPTISSDTVIHKETPTTKKTKKRKKHKSDSTKAQSKPHAKQRNHLDEIIAPIE